MGVGQLEKELSRPSTAWEGEVPRFFRLDRVPGSAGSHAGRRTEGTYIIMEQGMPTVLLGAFSVE